jgi:hypothetical protein
MKNENRSVVAGVLAVLMLVGVYGWIISSSYAQQPQYKQHFNDPSAPYPWHPLAGAQFNLSVTTSTPVTLTVPTSPVANATVCATITVEAQAVRRTSNGATPVTGAAGTGVGTLMPVASGAPVYDCGPLSSYKFIAMVTGAFINVEYFY